MAGENLRPGEISNICCGRRNPFGPDRKRIVNALLSLGVPINEVGQVIELQDRPDGRRRYKKLGAASLG